MKVCLGCINFGIKMGESVGYCGRYDKWERDITEACGSFKDKDICKSYDKSFKICKNASCIQRNNHSVTCPMKGDEGQWNP